MPPNPYSWGVEAIPIRPERKAQLEDYAARHGQDPAAALDDALAAYLESEQQEHNETVNAVQEAYKNVKAGQTRPAAEFLEESRRKHGLPR